MANCIAWATGYDANREKVDHRLGSQAAEGQANTWRTFCTAWVRADGSGHVEVRRDGKTLHYYEFGPETE